MQALAERPRTTSLSRENAGRKSNMSCPGVPKSLIVPGCMKHGSFLHDNIHVVGRSEPWKDGGKTSPKRSIDHAVHSTNDRLHTIATVVEIVVRVLGAESTSTTRSMTECSRLRIAIALVGWGMLVRRQLSLLDRIC